MADQFEYKGNPLVGSWMGKYSVKNAPGLPSSAGNTTGFMNSDYHYSKGWEGQLADHGGTTLDSGGIDIDTPSPAGSWMEKGKFGLDVAKFGLNVWNAYEANKMNKFMRGYYGDQLALQRADFSNNARSANQALDARSRRIASAQGMDQNAYATSQMKQWGAKETV